MSNNSNLIPTLTVDGPTTRDKDDGIWLLDDSTLLVSITAVAASIRKDSDIDRTAHARGESLYRASSTRHMMPRHFSEGNGSLVDGSHRYVLALRIDLSSGLISPVSELTRQEAHVRGSLTYAEFSAIVMGQQCHDESSMLRRMAEIASALLESRRTLGALAIYDLNAGWALSEDGAVVPLRREQQNIGYIVNQEFMILANRALAHFLLEKRLRGIFRNHTAHPSTPERPVIQTEINQLLSGGGGIAAVELFRQRYNLLMGRARLSPTAQGHFGLNLPYYAQGTSPLRRFGDLVNQRVIWASLKGEEPPYTGDELTEIADHLNSLGDLRRQATEDHLKSEAKSRAADMIATEVQGEFLAQEETTRFYRLLRVASESMQPSGVIAEAIRLRAETDLFTLKEAVCILFDPPKNPEWQELRRVALDWITQSPSRAMSLLMIAHQSRSIPKLRIASRPINMAFESSAHLDGQEDVKTPWYGAATKKDAEQRAAVALLYVVAGEEAPDLAHAEVYISFELAVSPLLVASEMYASALNQASVRLKVAPPEYRFEHTGPPNDRDYQAWVTMEYNGRKYTGEATGRSKNAVRNMASKNLIDQVNL